MRYEASVVIALVLLTFAVVTAGQTDADKPGKASVYTTTEYREEVLAFNRRTLAGAYEEVGSRGAWDNDALEFLERFAVYLTYNPKGTLKPPAMPKPQELLASGQALIAAGCDDSLVRYAVVVALEDTGQVAKAAAMLIDVVTAIDDSPYPHYRVWAAARRLARLAPATPAGQDAGRIAEQRLRQLPFEQGIGDFERRDWLAQLWEHVGLMRSRELQANYVEGLRLSERADPWMVDVLEGRVLVKRAWDARGYGFAGTVTDDGWARFHADLRAARDALTRAWKLRPNLPEAPTEMITVAMGAGDELDEDPRAWFARATAAHLDWEPAYDAIFEALMPRWGGSHDAVLQIGLDAAATKRYDTGAPWQLGRAASLVAADFPDGWAELLRRRPALHDRLVAVSGDYVAFLEPRRGDGLNYYLTMPAALAWRTGRYAEARRAIEAAGGRVDPKPFLMVGAQHAPAAVGSAWVRGGPQGEAARAAEDAMTAGDTAGALAKFRALAAALADQPQAKPYLDARIGTLDRRLRYAAGEWVDLQPAGGLSGWMTMLGKWEVAAADGALVGTFAPGQRHAYAWCEEDFGDQFEVSARLETLDFELIPCFRLIRLDPRGGAGIARGATLPGGDVLLARDHVSLLDEAGGHPLPAAAPIRAPVDFVLRCKGGRVDVKVNDQEWADVPFEPAGGPGVRIGVGAQGSGTVRFTGLKVRKLDGGAGEPPEREPARGR